MAGLWRVGVAAIVIGVFALGAVLTLEVVAAFDVAGDLFAVEGAR